MQLIITEKPSMGMSLASALGARERKDGYIEGNGYIVSWCIGHLVGLADAYEYNEQYGKWRQDDLPIIPEAWKYVVFESKKQQFNILRNLMNRSDVESLVCATDAGREGELIFRFVYQMANCKKPFSRLWISSMEENAIKTGFANLKDGSDYDTLYYSALCRAKADWLIGINATRLFSTLYGKTLNVGRVQTPTLAMIAHRQQKISGFVKEKYHIVRLNIDGVEALSEHIQSKEEAAQIQGACHNRQALCISLTKEQKTISPPKLFDLTSLQRESNCLFGYTAKQTLDAAQKLYEAKLITYPRTDSKYLTSDMTAGLPVLAQVVSKFINIGEIAKINVGQVVNDAKVSDHHAIVPTAELGKADIKKLSDTERQILNLISVRLLCAIADKHVYEAITATFDCNGYNFTAKGKALITDGWKAIENRFISTLKLKSNDTDTEDSNTLPLLHEKQTFENAIATATEHYTQPPKPYTEDTLLSAMENAGAEDITDEVERKGLGTSATRAAVIEKLIASGFITRKGRQLIPTTDGEKLIQLLPEALKSPTLTAQWENSLTEIAKGKTKPDSFIQGIEEMTRALVSQNIVPIEEYKSFFNQRLAIGNCSRCGGNILESKKNFYCENKKCQFVMWKTDRFFTSRKKELTKTIAAELLKNGKAKVKGLYSEEKDKTYDAVILLADTGGKYVNYRFYIPKDRQNIRA